MSESTESSTTARTPEVERFLPLVVLEDIADALTQLQAMRYSEAMESLRPHGAIRAAIKTAVLDRQADGPDQDGNTRIASKIELLREWSIVQGYGHSFDEFEALLLQFLNKGSTMATIDPFVTAVGSYADSGPQDSFRQHLLRAIRFVQLFRSQADFSRDLFNRLVDIDREDVRILFGLKELGGDRYFVPAAAIEEKLDDVSDLTRRRRRLVEAKLVESKKGKGGGAKLTRAGAVAVNALS